MNFWGKKSVFFISGLSIIIIGFIGACWWFLKPTYVPLLQQNDKNIQANVINILDTSNIPYVIKNNTIEVEESKIGEAKIALDKGGLSNPETVGFELFNETDYGMSDFVQKINFQRALEGELARSIMTMDGMKYARVHLTPEKDTIYEVDKATAKASVVIETLNNTQLSRDSIEGIQNLVSSAVNGLEAKNVVLLNQQGEIISNNLDTSSNSLKRSEDLEAKIESKVRSILYQSFNINKVSVSANVQINLDKRKVVREKPILSDAGILLLKKKETSSTILGADNTNSSQKDSSHDNEYAIGKETSEIEYGSERISKVNVGVIVPSTLGPTQLQNIQQVLEAGLGIDKKRGDNLVLVSSMIPAETVQDQKTKNELLKTDNEKKATIQSSLTPFMIIVIFSLVILVLFLILRFVQKPSKKVVEADSLTDEEREKILVNLKYWLGKN
ncbi:flagellar basal-body MS-ring/collar protein FliF [Acinetobacter baumannii]|uniref:flagellar basal-body MS-ring/collar protein FliF n=1 Tax=Acinetobacter baumannii TaxID=470 RepID=UPI00244B913B|nr:flagellar basal-body MS-ring/collar protein FliF [Acinetobacter baumannii]MDH2521378.1 flagellar basal-body MS-ring/collar protein FliF [Acinetobacter baumannii]